MSKIQEPLKKIFDRHRIVFWYDTDKELRADFETLDLQDVKKIELGNDEFAVKHRILRENPGYLTDSGIRIDATSFVAFNPLTSALRGTSGNAAAPQKPLKQPSTPKIAESKIIIRATSPRLVFLPSFEVKKAAMPPPNLKQNTGECFMFSTS